MKLNKIITKEQIEEAGAKMLQNSMDKSQKVQRVLRLSYISPEIFKFGTSDERVIFSFFENNKSELIKHCKDDEDLEKFKNYAIMAYSYKTKKKFLKSLQKTNVQDTF